MSHQYKETTAINTYTLNIVRVDSDGGIEEVLFTKDGPRVSSLKATADRKLARLRLPAASVNAHLIRHDQYGSEPCGFGTVAVNGFAWEEWPA